MPGETQTTRNADSACPENLNTKTREFLSVLRSASCGLNWGNTSGKRNPLVNKCAKLAATSSALCSALLYENSAFAANRAQLIDSIIFLDRNAILLFAVFGGAVSFALLSAFWLIRERAKIGEDNDRLRKKYSGIKADRDRLASLVEVDDQCIALWDSSNNKTRVLGVLPQDCGAPENQSDFLAFGKWLNPDASAQLESAIDKLRTEAVQFTLNINTLNGQVIETQGRVSGGNAFVRFIKLSGARQELAKINKDHKALYNRFALIEKLFENLSEPIWIRDREGGLAYVNTAYARAVEADDSDNAIKLDKQLFDTKEREKIREAINSDNSYHATLPAVVAGDRRAMETLCVATQNGSCGVAIDRSDVDAVRATLKHTIESHEQTFDYLGTAIAIFDANQKLQFHNSSFQQLWQLTTNDLEGEPSNSHILDTLRDKHALPEQSDWRRWKEQQLSIYHSTETREENWHLPDGRTLRVVVNPQNQGGASWVFENVTEELALKSTYNSLVRVQGETLDHLNEAVAVFGSDGKIRLTNPAFHKLWGFAGPHEIEGLHVKEITDKISNAVTVKEDWNKICLGITGVEDDRNDLNGLLELTSGAIHDYHLVYLPEGQSMLTLADMTATVNIERALKERNDALEESDSLKNSFLQHVSYELRAPLTSISGFAEILTTNGPGKLNAKQSEYLDYISKSSDVLKALIDDILDLTTIDAGAMQLDLQKVEIEDIVNSALGKVSSKIDRFQIKTNITISKDARTMIADPLRLNQILSNLLSNAVNVSPDGGRIDININRSRDMMEIGVRDQGPGIPEDSRQTIFERFETVHGSTRKRGAGLGLSIAKSFVELHGGSIQVEGVEGKGARFVCHLPLEPVANLQAAE